MIDGVAGRVAAVVEAATTYATARIETDPSRSGGRLLFLDGIECSYVDLHDPTVLEFGYVRRIGDAIDLAAPKSEPLRVTHLGGGGCTLPRYVAATRPRSRQFVYEYDRGLVELARRELGLRTDPKLTVKVGDARARLANRSDDACDIVVGDCFRGREIPAHLVTVEFVRDVHRVLAPDGSYLLNLIDEPPLRTARSILAALRAIFAQVAVSADADVLRGKTSGNLVAFAADVELPLAALRARASRGAFPDRTLDSVEVAGFVGTARPFTDPH